MVLIPVENTEEHYQICKNWFEDKKIIVWLQSVLRLGKYYKVTHEMMTLNKKNKLFFIQEEKRFIGLIGLMNCDPIDKRAEAWYLIGAETDRKKGMASGALEMVKHYALDKLKYITLYAHASEFNKGSIKVLEKCGFERVGKYRSAFFSKDSFCDLLVYDCILMSM